MLNALKTVVQKVKRFFRKVNRHHRPKRKSDADDDDLKLGKFFKNVAKGIIKAAPVVMAAGAISPTLFGLVGPKTALGKILSAGGKLGKSLFTTKGKFDPKKAAMVAGGLSLLETARQQRRAEDALNRVMAQQSQYASQLLLPSTQMANALMGTMASWAVDPYQILSLYGTPQFFNAVPPSVRQAALMRLMQGGGTGAQTF